MDPRRIPELSEAAARGAARKAAADARQQSIQAAMTRSRGNIFANSREGYLLNTSSDALWVGQITT